MFCFNCFQSKIKILCPICYEIGNMALKCGHINVNEKNIRLFIPIFQ